MTTLDGIDAIYELTALQQGMLFHAQYAPDSSVYTIQLDIGIEGELDAAAFESAWQALLARYGVLRTGFMWERIEKPYQVVHRNVAFSITRRDWSALPAAEQQENLACFIAEDRDTLFDLKKPPLMRVALVSLGQQQYRMVWTFHHIILEGWSAAIVLKEFWQAYADLKAGRAPQLPPTVPYAEYIQWLARQDRQKAKDYWKAALKGLAAPTLLPIDKAASAGQGQSPAAVHDVDLCAVTLLPETQRSLQALARSHRVTLNTLFQGAWALLLSRYAGEDDVAFGAVVSGRPAELAGAESMVGLFVNTLPVRIHAKGDDQLGPWLRKIQLDQAAMREFEYSALVDVQACSEMAPGQPLFHSVLAFENWLESEATTTGDLAVDSRKTFEASDQPLTLFVTLGGAVKLVLMYDVERFERAAVERMLGHCVALLEGMAASQPEAKLSELSMMSAAERARLLGEWSGVITAYPRDKGIPQLFEEQVAGSPEAVAVEFQGQVLTYAQLNERANQLAHRLVALGVKADVPVGLLMERSLEMVVAVLGILKAGGAYLPLDPNYPPARLQFILEDAKAPVLLVQSGTRDKFPSFQGQMLALDTDWVDIGREPKGNPHAAVSARQLAYLMYTSGSTGRPKGTCIEHRSVVRLVRDTDFIELGPEQVFLQFAPVAFDASTLEIWGALLNGGKLVVAPPGPVSLADLGQTIQDGGVTVLWLTAALFNQMVNEQPGSLRGVKQLFAGGEALSVPHVQRMLDALPPTSRLVNGYGPTENTTFTCCHAMQGGSRAQQPVPIGRPIANTRVYILDAAMQPVPVGVTGELYIGGEGLAREYLNQPELNAQKFVRDPFSAEPGARLYRSGDRVRWREDGTIEFVGRIDFQVKIRGFRIEPGEIEAVLCQHPQVREAAVLAREDDPAEGKYLCAYVVARPEASLSANDVREHLKASLPQSMMPSAIVMLERMPITANGKLDRAALPAPESGRRVDTAYVAPRTEMETRIAGVWQKVLGVSQVGIDDNFFELGGNSLLLLQAHGWLKPIVSIDLAVVDLFRFPSVRDLAGHVDAARHPTSSGATAFDKIQERARKRKDAFARRPISSI